MIAHLIIRARKLRYGFGFRAAVRDWLVEQVAADAVASIETISNELQVRVDGLEE